MLDKNYNPKSFEENIYKDWEESGDFKPDMAQAFTRNIGITKEKFK